MATEEEIKKFRELGFLDDTPLEEKKEKVLENQFVTSVMIDDLEKENKPTQEPILRDLCSCGDVTCEGSLCSLEQQKPTSPKEELITRPRTAFNIFKENRELKGKIERIKKILQE